MPLTSQQSRREKRNGLVLPTVATSTAVHGSRVVAVLGVSVRRVALAMGSPLHLPGAMVNPMSNRCDQFKPDGSERCEFALHEGPHSWERKPVPEKCVIGEYCRLHQFVHGAEAEELRERFEKLANGDRRNCKRSEVRHILDDVDARDSCALVESAPSAPAAAADRKDL